MRLVIIGAGGHGQVIADAVLRAVDRGAAFSPIFIDDRIELHGRTILGLKVAGGIDILARTPHDGVVVAIGENLTRRRICERLAAAGERFVSVIHPTAVIAPDVVLGEGVMVAAGVVVNTGTRVGAHAILNTACTIDHHNTVGAWAHVAPGAHTGGDASIGEGALVGIGATVMPSRKVGRWAVVGAGSLVYNDVPPDATVAGVPAHPIVDLE